MADRLQQERAEFERQLLAEGYRAHHIERGADGFYLDAYIKGAWMGWLLRARATAGVPGTFNTGEKNHG